MAILLGTEEIQRHNLLRGQERFSLAAGEKLTVKRGPQGSLVDVFNDNVPNNKAWEVLVFIQITETSA